MKKNNMQFKELFILVLLICPSLSVELQYPSSEFLVDFAKKHVCNSIVIYVSRKETSSLIDALVEIFVEKVVNSYQFFNHK